VVHTKPPGGPFWQLVELFLTLPRRLAARCVSLTAALVVAVAGSGPRPFTVTATQVPASAGPETTASAAMALKRTPAIWILLWIMMPPSRTTPSYGQTFAEEVQRKSAPALPLLQSVGACPVCTVASLFL